MKLTYQDHTPDEYEPPYFVPVDESGVGHFHVSTRYGDEGSPGERRGGRDGYGKHSRDGRVAK